MVTRLAGEDAGTRLAAVGGEVVELEETGAPVGTQVSVSRLFYNTPARLKFLKRDAVEAGHIAETLTRFFFSHPQVAFRLNTEGREAMQHGGGDLSSAVLAAWGREIAEAMVPVGLELPGMAVTGLVSGPALHRASRSRQSLYVNRRWVRNRSLTHGLEEGYRGVLPEGRFPAAVVLMEVDASAVDVNVHPTKAEVRLSRERDLHHLTSRAVREAMGAQGVALEGRAVGVGPGAAAHPGRAGSTGAEGQQELPSGWAGTLAAPGVLSPAFQARAGERPDLRPLAQLRRTYILVESSQGLLVVDQHRAQERVLYERFAQARLGKSGSAQALLEPASVQLGHREAAALGEELEEMSALGFRMEAFGRDAYLVRAVPAELAKQDAAALVRDLAEELAAGREERALERRRERLLITLSCRSAIKAGEALSYEEMAELLRALAGTSRPYTCPHGWPIVMTISNFEIDRKFNR
jgi:DNA mismatch repair protein MutL